MTICCRHERNSKSIYANTKLFLSAEISQLKFGRIQICGHMNSVTSMVYEYAKGALQRPICPSMHSTPLTSIGDIFLVDWRVHIKTCFVFVIAVSNAENDETTIN